jgi:PAS domain S-box-containing protein
MEIFPRRLKIILMLVAIILLLSCVWYYKSVQQRYLQDTTARLESIIQLTINRITDWRNVMLRETIMMMESPYYVKLAERWDGGPREEDIDEIMTRSRVAQQSYYYSDALYVDVEGKIYLSLKENPGSLSETTLSALNDAFKTGKAVITDLYIPAYNAKPHYDLIMPFFAGKGPSRVPNSAFIFQYESSRVLDPIINFWPGYSSTAESLLLRREDDSVLFLNDARHKKDTALSLKILLNQGSIESQAVQGISGVIEGKDYRGEDVIAIASPVPDTSWVLVVKIDKNEIFSGLIREYIPVLLSFMFLVGLISLILGIFWQRNEKAHYRTLFEMETARRKSEERYRNALDGIMEGCQIIDFNWRLIYLNAIALKHSGRTKEGLLGRTLMESYPGFEKSETFTSFNKCMVERIPQHIESPVEFPDGTVKWYDTSAHPIPEGIFVLINDITERKLAEADNDRLVSAIEQSGECVVIIDKGRIVRYVNPAYERVTGRRREEVIGHRLDSDLNENNTYNTGFWATLESGKPWSGRLENRRKDGSLYTEDATVSPVFNKAGDIVNYVSVSRDITQYLELQKEKERLQDQFLQIQKMESVGRLAGGVAHDFNNMLNVISGHAQLAMESLDPTDPVYRHLSEIYNASLRSSALTRQLLAFARKQTIAPRVLDLNSAIENLLNMLQRLIGEDIDLEWGKGENLWPVRIDPTQIDQILANLAVNARDAIEKHGKITISLKNTVLDEDYCRRHQGSVPGNYVMINFSDDGCGMSREVLDHLFEPFFTTKTDGKGTGLGLATVYGIVKQNEGFISVYSEPGSGTTFKIYLPRYQGSETAGAVEIENIPITGGTETILVVEDEKTVLELTKDMLERLGYQVIAINSPDEAIRLAKNFDGKIDLLLVDVIMPGMTGRDLSEHLSTLRPGIKKLFMSGYTADIITYRGVLEEGVFFIQKPYSIKSLAEKVRAALGQRDE